MTHPDTGVELLERALGYTRAALLHVRPHHLSRPTPCGRWDLDLLLDHMDDTLDAFAEGATGTVALTEAARPLEVRVETLQVKACALLGAWTAAHWSGRPATVTVGGFAMPADLVARGAALEITTHGWDLAQATGHAVPVPDALARDLLPVALALVTDDDRGPRFAAPVPTPPAAGAATQLLGFLGRSDPAAQVSRNRPRPERSAS